ncbi:MAG: hypothetical protein WAV90_09725 [Gordonia amarae]
MNAQARLQFCRGEQDITDEFHAEDDATEVRLWSPEDLVIVAVAKTGARSWSYADSDYGPDPRWDTDRTFGSWQEALATFGHAV